MGNGSIAAFRFTIDVRVLKQYYGKRNYRGKFRLREMGYHGLLDEDLYLAEVNLEDLESSSGEQQEYWLVAIRAAQEAGLLSGAAQQHMGCIEAAGDRCFIA
jgi:hypothetical protein